MFINQISIFLENKPGTLNAMTNVLAENNVDLRAMYLAEAADFGIARIIVDNCYSAAVHLRDAGYVCSITPVLGVQIPDTPGGLNDVLNILTEAGINVEYMYAFMGKKNARHAYMIFRVADNNAATAALAGKGIKVLSPDAVCNL